MSSWLSLWAALSLAVPYVAQIKDGCGAASLAMVSAYWGHPLSQEEIAARLLVPDLHGIPGSRLAAYAEENGLSAFRYRGDWNQMEDSLAKGRPLIVAWKTGRKRYHNVVVVGCNEDAAWVHDPARGAARKIPRRDFEKRWKGAGYWTLLVVPQ